MCDGGFQTRFRSVVVPTRGEGKCPKAKSASRYGIQRCNAHKCMGDELCTAKQDLVLSIDASGSLTEKGFKTVRDFSAGLIDKYMGKYYGVEGMRIGVVQFGNGEILSDGSVSNALLVQELTSDMAKVKASVQALQYKKGFTNMAQAFEMAAKILNLGGRQAAQSAVMTITDGKPSFVYQTYQKVQELKDKATKLFFVPVTPFDGAEMKLLKKWASKPWSSSVVRIPGLSPMGSSQMVFQQKLLVKFCPEAFSPSARAAEEKYQGLMLVRESGHCGMRGPLLSTAVSGAQDCAARARRAGFGAFSLGTQYARGRCYGEALTITPAMLATFEGNRVDPPCASGQWTPDDLHDFYILNS